MMRAARALCSVLFAACGGGEVDAPTHDAVRVSLDDGVVARVDGDTIAGDTVARIARAQSLDLPRARDLAVVDALFAAEARTRGLDTLLGAQQRAALARALLDDLSRSARDEGPPTDDELSLWTRRLYYSLDRPEGFRTVHVVVRTPPDADAAAWARAEAIAAELRTTLEPVAELARSSERTEQDPVEVRFLEVARAYAAPGVELVAEPLPPIATDGYTVQPEGRQRFDPAFVTAVTALHARGALSAPFRSSFGVHVALLTERTPALRVPLEQRRELLTPDIWDERIRTRRAQLLERLRAEQGVEVERSADKLLEQAIAR